MYFFHPSLWIWSPIAPKQVQVLYGQLYYIDELICIWSPTRQYWLLDIAIPCENQDALISSMQRAVMKSHPSSKGLLQNNCAHESPVQGGTSC